MMTGEETGLSSFFYAFLGIAILAASSALPILSLSPDTGQMVSGHKGARPTAGKPSSLE